MCVALHRWPAYIYKDLSPETEAPALTDVSLDVISKVPVIAQLFQKGKVAMVNPKDTTSMPRINGGDETLLTRVMVRWLCGSNVQQIVSRRAMGGGYVSAGHTFGPFLCICLFGGGGVDDIHALASGALTYRHQVYMGSRRVYTDARTCPDVVLRSRALPQITALKYRTRCKMNDESDFMFSCLRSTRRQRKDPQLYRAQSYKRTPECTVVIVITDKQSILAYTIMARLTHIARFVTASMLPPNSPMNLQALITCSSSVLPQQSNTKPPKISSASRCSNPLKTRRDGLTAAITQGAGDMCARGDGLRFQGLGASSGIFQHQRCSISIIWLMQATTFAACFGISTADGLGDEVCKAEENASAVTTKSASGERKRTMTMMTMMTMMTILWHLSCNSNYQLHQEPTKLQR